MKKNILFGAVLAVFFLVSCTPYIHWPSPFFLADTETDILVTCYDCPNKGSVRLVQFSIIANDTLSCETSTQIVDRANNPEDVFKYDIKVLDNSVVYVFDFFPLINNVSTELGMPISAAELYDTIMSQQPELIGTHVLKIEDNEIHDISKIAYKGINFSFDFYVDLEGREVK